MGGVIITRVKADNCREFSGYVNVNNCRTRCDCVQFFIPCKLLYVFRLIPSPIIGTTPPRQRKVVIRFDQCHMLYLRITCAPDDGLRYHPKHVEQSAENKKLYIVASCWTVIDIDSRCTDT